MPSRGTDTSPRGPQLQMKSAAYCCPVCANSPPIASWSSWGQSSVPACNRDVTSASTVTATSHVAKPTARWSRWRWVTRAGSSTARTISLMTTRARSTSRTAVRTSGHFHGSCEGARLPRACIEWRVTARSRCSRRIWRGRTGSRSRLTTRPCMSRSKTEAPIWMAYPVKADGTLAKGRVFADSSKLYAECRCPRRSDVHEMDFMFSRRLISFAWLALAAVLLIPPSTSAAIDGKQPATARPRAEA